MLLFRQFYASQIPKLFNFNAHLRIYDICLISPNNSIDRCSRKKSLAGFMTGAAVFLCALAILQLFLDLSQEPTIVLALCLTGKLFAAAARASARTLTGESFPTSIRNMGFGMVGVSASLVGLVAPQLAYLGSRTLTNYS